ncbi:MAG TPA: Vms1/Ankzf1 family peptidyl-tRNA hydrolase, partial [Actinomycetota bacterium]|nr:Vms1/Ankzf1 family peptidyl-tRNA hydrolase [Actinomycetota bacterium]
METSEAMPTGGAAAPDLADILRHEGPYLSLYLETAGDVETPRARSEQRWRSLRGSLEGADLPDDLLDTIGGIVADAHLQGPGLAVIATREEVRHVEHGSQPPRSDVALVADLPALGPLLGWRLHAPAHMVVLADRTGADIFGFRYGRPDIHREAEGDDLHVARSSPGGWSQRRFQERAENAWEENAEVAAAEVVRVAHAVDPRLIVVAGDVRAVNLLREALPPELATLIQEVGGGRAADGSREAIAEEAA